jgi:hypothetical protein
LINCQRDGEPLSDVRCARVLPVILSALLSTTPPLVQAPPEPKKPVYSLPVAMKPRPPPTPLDPATLGLYFSPLSLFSLSFWLEADLALIGGLDVFANVGGGPLGQFGFDAGLRYYVLGSSLDGFYLDLRGSGFSLPALNMWMFGPGAQIGHSWRVKRFTLSIALGVTTWFAVSRAKPTDFFILSPVTDAEVIVFPGLTQPPGDRPGVQPTVRISLGPWF